MAFPTSTLLVILSLLVATCTLLWRRRGHLRLPPGPRGLPIVGYIPFVHQGSFHLQLAELAKTYGPIMSLRLGAKLSVVISSPATAREVLRSQDAIFANRVAPAVLFTFTYGGQDMIWSSVGPLWRLLRKLSVRDIMAPSRLDAFIPHRQFEVRQMLHRVMEMAGSPVDLGEENMLTAFNSIMSMVWGGSLEGENRETVGSEFRRVIKGAFKLADGANLSDFFPFLAKFELQGINREAKKTWDWIVQTLDDVVKERMKKNMEGEGVEKQEEVQDILQLLLTFLAKEGEANNFNVTNHKSFLLVSHLNYLFPVNPSCMHGKTFSIFPRLRIYKARNWYCLGRFGRTWGRGRFGRIE